MAKGHRDEQGWQGTQMERDPESKQSHKQTQRDQEDFCDAEQWNAKCGWNEAVLQPTDSHDAIVGEEDKPKVLPAKARQART